MPQYFVFSETSHKETKHYSEREFHTSKYHIPYCHRCCMNLHEYLIILSLYFARYQLNRERNQTV